MTASSLPPSGPPVSGWVFDPGRDFVCYRLIDLAAMVLCETFEQDALTQDYRRWLASLKRKSGGRRSAKRTPPTPSPTEAEGATPAPAPTLEMNVWRRSKDYTIRVLALSQEAEFKVLIHEKKFQAEIFVLYDYHNIEVLRAHIESFVGDRANALQVTGDFIKMFDRAFEESQALPTKLEDPTIVAQVARIVNRLVVAAMPDRLGEGLTVEDECFLADTPDALWALRDGFIERAQAKQQPQSQAQSQSQPVAAIVWRIVLERQLEGIRFKAEHGHDWAVSMIDRYQDDLLAMAGQPDVDIETWQALVIVLDRAKIPIRPEIRAASVELVSGAVQVAPPVADIVRAMEEIVETGGGDPFRIASHMFDAMTMMPPDFADLAVSAIAGAPLPVLRDVLPLVLLAPEEACRRAAGTALERMASEKRLTAAGLRRLITLRSWLPESERRPVDQAIRRARLAGVDCAPWPTGQIRSVIATTIDGSGCQSLLSVAKDGNRHLFAGILTKQGFGVRDVLAERGLSRRDGEAMLADVGSQVLSRSVGRSYLDRVVQHALFTGVANDRTAPLALLAVAEALGAAEWRAERLNSEAELERLLGGLPADLSSPAAVTATLLGTGRWFSNANLTDSWFEDDEDAREICARYRRAPKKAIDAVLTVVIEPRRRIWAERLVWMALWSGGNADGGISLSPSGLPHWYEYALAAKALYEEQPLAELPLMTGIARQTVVNAGHAVKE